MAYVAVEPGVRIYVDDSGGVGPPVVFMHGWPLDSRQWEYQIAALQPRGLRCVAIDCRGFGRSDHAWGHYSYDIFADDLKRILDELELDGTTLVGFSLGAGTALRYMSRHRGARVTRVALCAVPGGWDAAAIDELAGLERPMQLRAACELLLGDGDGAVHQWLYEMGLGAMPYATRRCLELLCDADLGDDLRTLAAPTLVVHARDDRLAPRPHAAPHDALAESRLVVLERGGHGAFFTARAEFNAALERFLTTPTTSPKQSR